MFRSMPWFFWSLFLVIAGCGSKPKLHIADLPAYAGSLDKVSYFKDSEAFGSSEPTHNRIPPHGPERTGELIYFTDPCQTVGGARVCYTNDRINSRLRLSVTEGGKTITSEPLGGSSSDVLTRFLGKPPATIYRLVLYSRKTIGIVHSEGFTLFNEGRFCKPFATNPNGALHFATDAAGTPLFFSSGPYREDLEDRPVSGWRTFNLSQWCA